MGVNNSPATHEHLCPDALYRDIDEPLASMCLQATTQDIISPPPPPPTGRCCYPDGGRGVGDGGSRRSSVEGVKPE